MAPLTITNRHTGETLALRRVVRDGQLALELKGTLPPRNEGPPLHIHHIEGEEGLVIAGTLGAMLDGRRIRVTAGQRARFPAGSAHRWWNDGDDTLVFEGYSQPLADLRSLSSGRVRGAEQRSARPASALLHGPSGLASPAHADRAICTAMASDRARPGCCADRNALRPLPRIALAGLSGPVRRCASCLGLTFPGQVKRTDFPLISS